VLRGGCRFVRWRGMKMVYGLSTRTRWACRMMMKKDTDRS
jgi:hypothetical protein